MDEGGISGNNSLNLLPPGLRFCPTDEDLVLHFLYHKANSHHHFSNSIIIPHLQLHLYNPWQFHGKTLSNGDNIHYFFSRVGESRATESGYWKDVLMDEPIFCSANGDEHNNNESPSPIQTSWIMQEYHIYNYLLNNTHHAHPSQNNNNNLSQTKSEFGLWVVCRVFEAKENNNIIGRSMFCYEEDDDDDNESELSYLDEMYLSLDDI
ncbi:hypothetical protein IC575_025028 [Cucumis melo]